jgi:hypothetical protein
MSVAVEWSAPMIVFGRPRVKDVDFFNLPRKMLGK